MTINTKFFGEITVDEDKKLTFPQGIIGFPELTEFMLIHNAEAENNGGIQWLQSLSEPAYAIPVMDPYIAIPGYNPVTNESLLSCVGEMSAEDLLILTTVTVPSEIEKTSINLMAPIIINTATRKGVQIITENDNPVKYNIYDVLEKGKDKVAGLKK